MKLIKIADDLKHKYQLTVCEPGGSDDTEPIVGAEETDGKPAENAPTEPCEPETSYEKIFQSVAKNIADQISLIGGRKFEWPFCVDFIISEQNKKEPLCHASIMSIGTLSGKPTVELGQDGVTELESELGFICLKGCSCWTSYIGSVNLTIGMWGSAMTTEEETKEKIMLLQTLVTQAYFSANDNRKLNDAPTLYMGGFQPC